jgi:YfiH family protein
MEENFFRFSVLSKFPEIVHGISTRRYGDIKFGRLPEEEVLRNRKLFYQDLGIKENDVIIPYQVHGSNVVTVGESDKGKGSSPNSAIPETDGLLTMNKGVYLMVTVADCLPVFAYDPVQKIVAVVHAGWRGIIDQIISKTIDEFIDQHSDPENIIVAIGPGICQKHFTVKSGVLQEFLDLYPKATFVINNDGYVDLKKAILLDLKRIGISKSNIEVSDACTVCQNGTYSSFRKEGENCLHIGALVGIKK